MREQEEVPGTPPPGESDAHRKVMEAILQVTEVSLTKWSLDDLLKELLTRIRTLLRGDTAAVLLTEPDGNGLVVRASSGLQEEPSTHVEVPWGHGIAGRIAATGKPLIVDDLSLMVEVVSPVLRESIRSMVGAPLIVDDRVTGVIHVGSTEPDHFTDDELALLSLVAERAASAIERARAEEALIESERRFRSLFEQAAVGMAEVALDGRWIQVNQRLCDIVGYTRQEMEQRTFQDITYQEDLALDLEHLQSLVEGRSSSYSMEKRYVRKDGSLVWANLTVSLVRKPSGDPDYFVSVAEDIDRRKKAEEERRQLLNEIRLRAVELDTIISSIADGIVIYGKGGKIVRMNPVAQAILGYSPADRAEQIESRVRKLRVETVDGRLFETHELPFIRALKGETVSGIVMKLHSAGPHGTPRWVSASAAPFHLEGEAVAGAVATFSDITEIHDLHERQQDLVRSVSHDLRTPLTSITGNAQLLMRAMQRVGIEERYISAAGAIVRGVDRMDRMIVDLVESARLESGQLPIQKQPVEVSDFIKDLLQRNEKSMNVERVRLETDRGGAVCADPYHLERIVVNLVSNALKYSDPDTEVFIHTERRNGNLLVTVKDQGDGILPEDKPHLFDRFYRAKGARKAEGLGLGLYITRMLVEAQGGRIWVESEPDMGSTFSFTVPVVSKDVPCG